MIIPVKTGNGSYNIFLERGALDSVGDLLDLERKVLIVTDSGVPESYSKKVASGCKDPYIITIKEGEGSKSMASFELLLGKLVENDFTRTDCVVAVGGGVVGDLSGFAASAYMRGIDFYNVPTTLLSQVDSSIGGKTAIDYLGIKNIVGAFYQPKAVVIDPDTLTTLPRRHLNNGLSEALKMSLIRDPVLFEIFEKTDVYSSIDEITERSLNIKKSVVEEDEKESGVRKILNFGHTLAHAIESASGMKEYLHGECVGMGMIPMCSDEVRDRLIPILKKLCLPVEFDCDADSLIEACKHDKKTSGSDITVVFVKEIGRAELVRMKFSDFEKTVRKALSK